MYRKLSSYLRFQRRYDEAIEALHQAIRLVSWMPDSPVGDSSVEANVSLRGASILENRRYMTETLLATGRATEAMRWLPEEPEPYPVNRLRDALLWANVCYQAGKIAEARDWVRRAYRETAENNLAHRRPDVDKMARQIE